MGVWIETIGEVITTANTLSHPSWVCGLKQTVGSQYDIASKVTPFVGVWIETESEEPLSALVDVTPFVGVWIETPPVEEPLLNLESHPSWVCGLKQQNEWSLNKLMQVTPFVGVWIETYRLFYLCFATSCHTLRGCVD